MMNKEKIYDGILGLAVGDALGVPFEFKERDTFTCRDMIDGGTWKQPIGTWSDDTSLTLATLDAIKKNDGNIVLEDIADNFCKWIYASEYTAGGKVFDCGLTTAIAIGKYASFKNVETCGMRDYNSNGNGSLMRILPLAFFDVSDEEIEQVSALTHANEISKYYCVEYVKIAKQIINGKTLFEILGEAEAYRRATVQRSSVSSSGYVIDTFDAAIWCLLNTSSYKDCVLTAVNLGDDTDTVAAVAGGLAGLYYGAEKIPKKWIEKIARLDYIQKLCCI